MSSPVPAGEPAIRHEKVASFVSRSAQEPRAVASARELAAFVSEESKPVEAASEPVTPRRTRWLWMTAGAALAAGAVAAAVLVAPRLLGLMEAQAPPVTPGRVTIATTPPGAEVTIDGQSRGLAPVAVPLDPGHHTIVLRRGAVERTIAVQVASGAEMLQHFEFAPDPAPVDLSSLSITTDPPGARVMIDGQARGTSPLAVSDLTVGQHKVTVTGDNGTVERQVTTEAGVASSVVFSLPRTQGVSVGWLSVTSPFEVQVVERGEVVGTSASTRIMIPAGTHDADIVNESLGFSERRRIVVTQGATAAITIDARAPLSANARPWAEVLIDGRAIGQTPIANFQVTLGTHQIVFRHPDLGERQQTIIVTAKSPNRIAADLTK